MAYPVLNEFTYADNGRAIKKTTYQDPDTGAQWDNFEDLGEAPGRQNGEVFTFGSNPYENNPQAVTDYNAQQRPPNMKPYNAGESGGSYRNPSTGETTVATPPQRDQNQDGGGAPPSPNRPTPYSQASGTSDDTFLSNSFLYPTDNPSLALSNVLRQRGYNPLSGNPAARRLFGLGNAAGQAYLQQGAQANARPSDPGADFGNYLREALGGGNLFAQINQARNQLPGLLGQVNASRSVEGLDAVNPMMNQLRALLDSNNGQGLLSIMSTLNQPFMDPRLFGAYQQGLGGAYGSGYNQFFQQGGPFEDKNADFLSYLMGGGR